MSSTRFYLNATVADVSALSQSLTGSAISLKLADCYSYQLVHSGTLSGTFRVEVSNDSGSWVPVDFDTMVVNADQSPIYATENPSSAAFVRPVFEWVSGTGSLSFHLTAKGS